MQQHSFVCVIDLIGNTIIQPVIHSVILMYESGTTEILNVGTVEENISM